MSDAREKQPARREINLCDVTKGNTKYVAEIDVWPYSGMKSEDVFSRHLVIVFWADGIASALGFASSHATVIGTAHDVWKTTIRYVGEPGPMFVAHDVPDGGLNDMRLLHSLAQQAWRSDMHETDAEFSAALIAVGDRLEAVGQSIHEDFDEEAFKEAML